MKLQGRQEAKNDMSLDEGRSSGFPSGLDRDLENARVLIEDEPWCDSPQKYRKAAEVILRRVLTVDPENESAKALLAKAEWPADETIPAVLPAPVIQFKPLEATTSEMKPLAETIPAAEEDPVEPTSSSSDSSSDFAPLIQTLRTSPENTRTRKLSVPAMIGIAVAVVLSGFLMFGFPSNKAKNQYSPKQSDNAPAAAQVPAQPPVEAPPAAPVADTSTAPLPVTQPSIPPTAVAAGVPAATRSAPAPLPPPVAAVSVPARPAPTVEPKPKAQAPAALQTGTLAVSSPTTVDIYMGEQFMGSAPTTLQLPGGNQRLEYRHKDMKKVVTYIINPNETTTAMVTFDVPVQINAKPWAQVFIEGSQRQALGQTPLSDVLVPIGSVLVFENPNFQGKRYRVKGTESTIQITFP